MEYIYILIIPAMIFLTIECMTSIKYDKRLGEGIFKFVLMLYIFLINYLILMKITDLVTWRV